MCGLIAVLGSRADEMVEAGLGLMSHRGIRSTTCEIPGSWAMGHVRLPIVGVGEEHDQPVSRGPWTVAFVGELLDFRERRPWAECDVGLAVDTWVKEGPKGFRKFDGFWHVIAHDLRDGSLHAVVDYLAQKPLYVRSDQYAVAVASEPDAVVGLGPVTLDEVYLSAVVKWGYCPEVRRTPYRGVQRMLPGEYVVLSPGGGVSWDRTDTLGALLLSPDNLREEVEGAVRRRVEASDVPVACLVSGGLDSSIAYTLARRYGEVHPYHVENGERDACLRVAPNAELLDCRDVNLSRALSYMQEPLDLGSLVPQVALSDAVARAGGERVCLTGDGADELFGGYRRAARYDSQASDVWHELVAWHLPRLDRVMMRNKIEVRSPFLARRVAAAALALPRKDRIDKGVLRDLFRRDLPPGVADLPKHPLRTKEVEGDREARSLQLVNMFREKIKERNMELCLSPRKRCVAFR